MTEVFSLTGPVAQLRHSFGTIALSDGRVMVMAGRSCPPCYTNASTEIYDPSSGTWSSAAPVPTSGPGTISPGYTNFGVSLLPDGKVFMAGGYDGYTCSTSSAALRYSPGLNSWEILTPMLVPRNQLTATTLLDGRVLLVGGRSPCSSSAFNSTEIYNPAALPNGMSANGNPLTAYGRAEHTATLLSDGKALVTGGIESISNSSGQLFDPLTGVWTEVGPMTSTRAFHTATLLGDGRVLVAGGVSFDGVLTYLNTAELWGVATGTISVTTNLPAASFTIAGPATYNGGGTSFPQPNAPAGTYTITYAPVNCFSTPVSETKILTAGGTIIFAGGSYQGQATLSVNVTPVAASNSATFSVNPVVAGMRTTGPYPVIQGNVWPQQYTVTFSGVNGFISPPQQTLGPDASCRIPFSGNYTVNIPRQASLSVTTNRSQVATFSVMDSAGNILADHVKSFGAASVNPGSYLINYHALAGYYEPLTHRIALGPGESASVEGKYRRLFLIAFTGWGNAPVEPNCLGVVAGTSNNIGSGVLYDAATWNLSGRGMTRLLWEVQQTPSLAAGARLAGFTFYSVDQGGNPLGNACYPASDSDHLQALNWLNPDAWRPDDLLTVVGHSYGGNRARLFVNSLRTRIPNPIRADLLITVDPVDWNACNIQTGFTQLFSENAYDLCDQSAASYGHGARSALSFRQERGEFGLGLKGYSLAAETPSRRPDYHTDIDDDQVVHSTILSTLLKLVREAQAAGNP